MSATDRNGNRRGAYRVRPASVSELDLAILEKRYRVVRGTVADVAIGGAQVQFDNTSLLVPLAGERVLLALSSESYNFDCTLWARVVASDLAAHERTLSFSFDQDSATLTPDNANFYTLFNRRARYRHLSAEGEPTLAAVVAPRVRDSATLDSITARIDDLSGTGCSLRVTPQAAQSLLGHDQLSLLLNLPGLAGVLQVACRVCHREHQSGTIRYGCAFEWAADADGRTGTAAVAAYVNERLAPNARLATDRRRLRP